ncbi:MAG: carbohydrate ABC transporter permease [Capsulimonadaceae bacterium]
MSSTVIDRSSNTSQGGTPEAPSAGWFQLQNKLAPYVFVSPFVIMFATFGIFPLLKSVILAFYATDGPKSQHYVGLYNFKFMFMKDPDFWTAVQNTVVYTLCSLIIQLPLALGLALLLNRKTLPIRGFWRLCIFAPNLLGSVFVGILFQQAFAAQYGLVNRAFHFIYHPFDLGFQWLGDPHLVMPAIVLVSLWLFAGYNMVYFLAGLQAVDKELYEAAEVDGANSWQQFLAVTIPGIKPILVFLYITSTIASLQLFDLPWIMLSNSAGPGNSGLTVVMYLYQHGFQQGDLGYASAVGWTLAFAILIISLVQVRITGIAKGGS